MESIELVEIYLEPVRSELESVADRIPERFTKVSADFSVNFHSILDFRGVWRGVSGKVMCAIDRAHRDLLGTSEIRVGTSRGTNPR